MLRIPRPAPFLATLLVLLGPGCTSESGIPDLGPCAEPRKGDTYGQIGIGTCLSGPVDVQFVERGGRTWLAVSNADPFRNFDGGSVLLLDWADTVGRFDDEVVLTADIASAVIPTEHFIGGLGWRQDANKNVLFVTRRLSEDSRTRTHDDSIAVYDLETTLPYIPPGPVADAGDSDITLKDDPGAVAVASDGRTFVLNYTDHSISVLDASGELILPIDLAPEAAIEPYPLDDADGSGSVAELDRLALNDETRVVDDFWQLTWIPGQYRAWSSTGLELERWQSGGGPPVPSGVPGELVVELSAVTQVEDPMVVPVQLTGISSAAPFTLSADGDFDLTMLYGSGGSIFRTFTDVFQTTDGLATFWLDDSFALLNRGAAGSYDELKSAPSIAIADGNITMYYQAATGGAPTAGTIARAISQDGLNYSTFDAPMLSPDGVDFTSFEQPYVQIDARMNVSRMWLSMFGSDDRYAIGYSESVDGVVWSTPVPILESNFTDYAAPVVRYMGGEYLMWATTRANTTSEQWYHVLLRSPDGIAWGPPEVLFDAALPFDARHPPRIAVAQEAASTWRVEGVDTGTNSLQVVGGLLYRDITHGYEMTVAAGHELSNDTFPGGRADLGVEPGSHYDFGGIDWLYVTTTGADERKRISVLEGVNDVWNVKAVDLIPAATGGNAAGVQNPVVFEQGGVFAMFYAAIDANGISRLHAATSPDGEAFTPTGPLFSDPDVLGEWAGARQEPRSVEVAEDGTVRLWFAGSNGSRYRIGALSTASFDASRPSTGWALEPGDFTPYQLGTGLPGSIDDSGAKDPMVLTTADGGAVMYYSGFDGTVWHLAHATRDANGNWVRRGDPATDETLPAMSGISRTFSAGGVESPVAQLRADGTFELWYTGADVQGEAGVKRLGKAVGRGQFAFADLRMPTYGDTLSFETFRGDAEDVDTVIELAQNIETFLTTGVGTTSLILDEERGFIYVPSKLSNLLYVVDIRDDTRVGAVDYNAMDLEGLIRLPTVTGNNGFRGGVISEASDRLYLTTRNPESIVVIDLNALVDDGEKEVSEVGTFASLPMQDTLSDAGAASVASIGGGHPDIAIVDNGGSADELLIVPHFRDNSASIFDLGLGGYGAEVAYLPWLGENPHRVRVSPDQRWAVVANYLGDVQDEQSSSTLAIIDLDPDSATYLQATNWIKNR